jgi:ABC-type multidrug transport system fused ATPase/permease subunit
MRLNDANIYPGIRPFDKEDSQFYFGRNIQIEELKARLVTSNFLAIVGSSGTGKSSLVRAGLIPHLEKDGKWLIAVVRPESSPIANLAAALNKDHVFGSLGDGYEKKYTRINLDYSSRGIIDTLKQSKYNGKLLLVIDQFEEIFRFKDQKDNREESMRFINLLLTAANEATSKVYIIITMRSDFLGRCSEFSGLPEKINEGQFLVPRLTRSQYKEAILRPLEVSTIKVSMSPSLASRVLNDIQDDPDQLPVLQHALMRTWKLWLEKHDNGKATNVIDIEIYEEVGGMETALGKHAHEILMGLGKDLAPTAKKIFQRITEFNSDGLGIRRPIPFGDLIKITGAKVEDIKEIVDAYRIEGVNFLMPPADQELTNDKFIDISHESLIRKWNELGEWMKEEQLDKGTLVKLAEDSDDYDNGKARLLSDRQLSGLLKWEKLKDKQFVAWASIYTPDVERKLDFLERSKRANYRNYVLKVVGIPALIISLLTFGYLYYLGQVQAEKDANETLYNRSKDYDQIKKLVTDSADRIEQITTLNRTLADANEKVSNLERNLQAVRIRANETIMLNREDDKLTRQIKRLVTLLSEKEDSLRIMRTEIVKLKIEIQTLRTEKQSNQEKEVVSGNFAGLSGTAIWLVFSTRQDSLDGINVMQEITKDRKGATVTLIKRNYKDLNSKLRELPNGIYAVGNASGDIEIDLKILHVQLYNMGLGTFATDSRSLGKNTVFTKSSTGIVVILSQQVTKK